METIVFKRGKKKNLTLFYTYILIGHIWTVLLVGFFLKPVADFAYTCVPGVIAGAPEKLSVEGREKVKKSPGKEDDVVTYMVKYDQLLSIAQT